MVEVSECTACSVWCDRTSMISSGAPAPTLDFVLINLDLILLADAT